MVLSLFKKKIPDSEIIQAIRQGETSLDRCVNFLYAENFPSVKGYVLKNGGSKEDAEEILQSGMVSLIEKIALKKVKLTGSIHGLLFTICKNLWIDLQRKAKRMTGLPDDLDQFLEGDLQDPLHFLIEGELQSQVNNLLNQIDKKCKKVLVWSDMEGRPMKWVAKTLGYSIQAAMNKKSKCRKEVREKIRKNKDFQLMVEGITAFPN